MPKLQDITSNNNFGKNPECYMVFIGFHGEKHITPLTVHIFIYLDYCVLMADIILETEMSYGVLW